MIFTSVTRRVIYGCFSKPLKFLLSPLVFLALITLSFTVCLDPANSLSTVIEKL